MLLTKVVEGFIRLFGGVHFDESTHPLDGGLFGAIADLDCLNPKGGKAAERKRRKRGSKQLQRNVSAVGSLTTQMMLDRHSLGVMRPSAPYATPGLSEPTSTNTYFPTYAPPLGPPPMERHSSDEVYGAGTNIMDAWKPVPVAQSQGQGQTEHLTPYAQQGSNGQQTQSTPLAWSPLPENIGSGYGQNPYTNPIPAPKANTGFSVIRGGRSDVQNPYSVKAGTGAERSLTISPPPFIRVSPIEPKPTHSRQQSSTAIIEDFDTRISPPQTPLYPPQAQAQQPPQMRRPSGITNNQGLAPPILSIPKRRSLNNLKGDSPTDSIEGDKVKEKDKEAKKKKRRSWFKSGDLPNSDDNDNDIDVEEFSDDEPGPSRQRPKAQNRRKSSIPFKEPAPFEPIPTVIDYDYDYDDQQRPRAGSKSSPGWRGMLGLKKKKSLDDMAEMARDENKARKAALAAESGAMLAGVPTPQEGRSFKVARRSGPGSASGPSSPSRPVPTGSNSTPGPITSPNQETPKSFRVKRGKDSTSKPMSKVGGYEDIPLEPTSTPPSSFKVNRPGMDTSPTSSFIVNRPLATPPQSPSIVPTGRASPDPHASVRGKGKASMFRPVSGSGSGPSGSR
jgi:hypothetical protein